MPIVSKQSTFPGSDSDVLYVAAITGLLGALIPACNHDSNDNAEAKVTSSVVDKEMTFDKFSAECDERGGFVQTHAVCSGNNNCKGVSYNKYSYTMTEHTCKALNSCGGMSCVLAPADGKKKGSEIFAESCAGCHGSKEGSFTYFVRPGTDMNTAIATFAARSPTVQTSIVAFGSMGANESGTYYTNMPGFHEKYSRAELERSVTYLRSLEIIPEAYGVVGETEEIGDVEEM
jgi:Cytochrome c